MPRRLWAIINKIACRLLIEIYFFTASFCPVQNKEALSVDLNYVILLRPLWHHEYRIRGYKGKISNCWHCWHVHVKVNSIIRWIPFIIIVETSINKQRVVYIVKMTRHSLRSWWYLKVTKYDLYKLLQSKYEVHLWFLDIFDKIRKQNCNHLK